MNIKLPALTEHQEQANFFTEVRLTYRNDPTFIYELLFSTLNGAWLGGEKSAVLWQKHKEEGSVQGVADVLYLQPRGSHPYLAIEMKRSDRRGTKNGGLTKAEDVWLNIAWRAGARVVICYTAEEAVAVFAEYMRLPVKENRPE